jgi:colanic acid/amylovoran biosynthesis glycosyltransferase
MNNIVLKVGVFPTASESFVLGQMLLIQDIGCDLRVIVNRSNDISSSSNPDVIVQRGIMNLIDEIPINTYTGFFKRFSKVLAGLLTFPPRRSLQLFSTKKFGPAAIKGRYFLEYIQLRSLVKDKVVHVQFGNNLSSLDKFKELQLVDFKLITTFHGFDAHFSASNKAEKSKLYELLFKHGEAITCNTPYLAEKLKALGCPSDKLHVVPVPVNTQVFCPSPEEKEADGKVRLLSVGRLIKLKGHAYGLEVVRNLVEAGLDVEYVIIGEGEEEAHLRQRAKELNIENSVVFLGNVSQLDVVEKMRQSDLLLMTSITDNSNRQEAQGLVTIEAQACGLPVVAFRSGGVPYTLIEKETGILVDEKDSDSMANAVQDIVADKALHKKMQSAAVKFVQEKYAQKVISENWRELYANV